MPIETSDAAARLEHVRKEIAGIEELSGFHERIMEEPPDLDGFSVSYAAVRNYHQGMDYGGKVRHPSYGYLRRVLEVFPQVRAEWLIRDEGEPTHAEQRAKEHEERGRRMERAVSGKSADDEEETDPLTQQIIKVLGSTWNEAASARGAFFALLNRRVARTAAHRDVTDNEIREQAEQLLAYVEGPWEGLSAGIGTNDYDWYNYRMAMLHALMLAMPDRKDARGPAPTQRTEM